jgi:hypothetical protein
MSLRQRTDRVVLFRLTEDEHQTMEEPRTATGGRSLSGFVRVEVLNPAPSVDIEPVRELVESMEQRLLSLENTYGKSARRFQSSCGAQLVDGPCAEKACT